jgi:hypothetical protein
MTPRKKKGKSWEEKKNKKEKPRLYQKKPKILTGVFGSRPLN